MADNSTNEPGIISATPKQEPAQSIAESFAALPEVEAIAQAGSLTSGNADGESDIDLYIYTTREIPVSVRSRLIELRAAHAELDNRFWEPGDEWVEAASGVTIDVMYRDPAWIEQQLERVVMQHQASVGYTTCLWHNVRYSVPLFDRGGWFDRLQKLASRSYPEELRQAIVAKNHPILRDSISSYLHQLEKAVRRGDLVSANHRVAALLASYFDILFAVNRTTNPGEKRLLKLAARCDKTPPRMVEQVEALLQAACSPDDQLVQCADELVDGLDDLLAAEGLLEPGKA
jgi:hypothetical protein